MSYGSRHQYYMSLVVEKSFRCFAKSISEMWNEMLSVSIYIANMMTTFEMHGKGWVIVAPPTAMFGTQVHQVHQVQYTPVWTWETRVYVLVTDRWSRSRGDASRPPVRKHSPSPLMRANGPWKPKFHWWKMFEDQWRKSVAHTYEPLGRIDGEFFFFKSGKAGLVCQAPKVY